MGKRMLTIGTPLTPQEQRCLTHRCRDDLTVPRTAKQLGVAPTTVTELCRRAYLRLGVRSIGAACWAWRGRTEGRE